MFRIDNASAAASLPAPQAAGTPGYFGRGDIPSGTPPTVLAADWANMVQEEIMSVVLAASITPDKTNHAQLLAAITAIVSGATPTHGVVKAAGDLAPASGTITHGFNVSSVTFSSARISVGYTTPVTNPIPVVNGGDSTNGSSCQSAYWGGGSSNSSSGFVANFGVSGGGGSITRSTFITVNS